MQREMNNLIIVGGSHRQCGKTEIASNIIKRLSKKGAVICLKISCHDVNESRDTKADFMIDDYWLVKEEPSEGTKSTDKMYIAGARVVYRLIVTRENLEEGFETFIDTVGDNHMIVCESNSLREIAKPALFVFINLKTEEKEKNSSARVKQFADIIIENDGGSFNPKPEKIKIPDLKANIKKAKNNSEQKS